MFAVLGCGMQDPPLQAAANEFTPIDVGPVNVELAGVVKFTWNLQSRNEFVPKFTTNSGEPLGGAVAPSRFEGSSEPKLEEVVKQTCEAAVPAIIALRFIAQTSEPMKVFVNKL